MIGVVGSHSFSRPRGGLLIKSLDEYSSNGFVNMAGLSTMRSDRADSTTRLAGGFGFATTAFSKTRVVQVWVLILHGCLKA